MIFVSVGTARDFSRLIKEVDRIAKDLKDEIIVQKGLTKYVPENCRYFDFVPRDKYFEFIKKADIVIAHGGVGTIINSLNLRKPTIVVPRRRKYNEHKNDHQMDIAKELEMEGAVVVCYDVKNLRRKIEEVKKIKLLRSGKELQKIRRTLSRFLENMGV